MCNFINTHTHTYSLELGFFLSEIYIYILFEWSGALTFEYGCTTHVGVDVGAGDAEVNVIYISFA